VCRPRTPSPREPFREVEAPAAEPNVTLQPVGELPLHARVEVVDVRRCGEPGARVPVAVVVGVRRVVAADHVGAPVEVEAAVGGPALVHAVNAAVVLLVRAPVVDDNGGHALDLLAVELPELRLESVLGRAQVVEPARHVALLGH
jgi:hypothetical protein